MVSNANTLTIEKAGRRYYVLGNTYPMRDQIRAAGCRWDDERRAWWTGKQAVAQELVQGAVAAPVVEIVPLDATVITGRARYNNKTYYVLWAGTTSAGTPGAKLCFRDGSRIFWAKAGVPVEILTRYDRPRSIAQLRAYAEQRKAEQAGTVECPVCVRHCRCGTGFCHHHHDGCDRCGAEH